MYSTVLLAGIFLLGTILGSFLNALSFRFNTGRSILVGRSRCMHCCHELSALDLVPIFSYLLLKGRCRYCKARIAAQYPLVEVAAGMLSLGLYLLNPEPVAYILHLLFWMAVLFIVVYDLRHRIIPWPSSLFLMGVSLLLITVAGNSAGQMIGLLSLGAGIILALPLLLLSLVSSGRWMGWGDSAFELSLGWVLGLSAGGTALMLAVWIGALVGSVLLALSKRVTMKSEIPFAPFLALGAALAYFFHVDFFSTILLPW